jgi:hypothetical protein
MQLYVILSCFYQGIAIFTQFLFCTTINYTEKKCHVKINVYFSVALVYYFQMKNQSRSCYNFNHCPKHKIKLDISKNTMKNVMKGTHCSKLVSKNSLVSFYTITKKLHHVFMFQPRYH